MSAAVRVHCCILEVDDLTTRPHRCLSDVGKGPAMVYVSAVVLTVLNLVFWVGILFNLPGT
jgi:hypothetical protein